MRHLLGAPTQPSPNHPRMACDAQFPQSAQPMVTIEDGTILVVLNSGQTTMDPEGSP